MADRKTLHFSKLEEFKKWLVKNDWEIKPLSRSDYEVLRAKKDSDWVIVYKKDDATEHYSLTNNSIFVVNRWIRERKMRKHICDEIRDAFRDKCKNTFETNPNMVNFITLHIGDVEEFLDKVEKGE